MSGVDVATLREALAKATLGPWTCRDDGWGGGVDIAGPRNRSWRCASVESSADAEMIVLLRNNADALLDALERAQAASEAVDMLVAQAERRGYEAGWDKARADAFENGGTL